MQEEKETVAVVEYFESCYGVEEKRIFKVFKSTASFEQYCYQNKIDIRKTTYGTYYSDSTYTYNVKVIELNP
ncbi:hypothetical protein [Yersinia phage fHe-Yen9-04]|uniref:Uncharacterized protein n=1 Tax=Yersinia phage fHe-Yen9-04 TaxID=2052742 RepID=A0A2C9CXU7_9CAUD|nr:hypothetical protein FDJ41_gp431 [Yersinia phage fHe-Yen9-04]SOK58749.1 hypothetical protein [Yersinia phage fHe-Yen9-04]VUE36518.1 hypothetical protein [Yersinia phage fHe-Yen9-04]